MQRRSNNPQEYGSGRVADVAFPFLVAARSTGEPTIVGNGAAKRKPALFSRFRASGISTPAVIAMGHPVSPTLSQVT
jgi:hypothetical protein